MDDLILHSSLFFLHAPLPSSVTFLGKQWRMDEPNSSGSTLIQAPLRPPQGIVVAPDTKSGYILPDLSEELILFLFVHK